MSEFKNYPYKAFILAAGFGSRLRPITNTVPKPLVQVNDRSLLWRTLDKLRVYGTRDVVVNAHYLPEQIIEHTDDYKAHHPQMNIHVSFEQDVFETGGGVLHALDFFDDDQPFFVIAGDNLWFDEVADQNNDDNSYENQGDSEDTHTYTSLKAGALKQLAQGWEANKMDIYTLMQPVLRMDLTKGVGDYDLLDDGRVRRSLEQTGPYMWTNIRLNHPRVFKGFDQKAFSFLEVMDACEKAGRFYAKEYDGQWHHISTPVDLRIVDAYVRSRNA